MERRPNNLQIYKKISQLRFASDRNDWNLCREVLQSLVCDIDSQFINSLILRYIRQFMNDELCLSVDIDLTIESLNVAIATTKIKEKLSGDDDQLRRILYEPGISNFRGTLSRITDFLKLDYCSEQYAEGFTNVISGLFMALLLQQWGKDNPELWYQWRLGVTTDDLGILAKHFWRHPETIEFSSFLWNEIADYVEKLL